jgi:Glutamine amidotransferases class-II
MMSTSSRTKVAKQALRRANNHPSTGSGGSFSSAPSTSSRRSHSSLTTRSRWNSRRGLPTALKLQSSLWMHQRPLFYSTEKVLRLKNSKVDESKTLYNANDETENCGVGLIANLKSIPSRHVVEVADEMLVRMAHRGGCGCDPASGDGAGE